MDPTPEVTVHEPTMRRDRESLLAALENVEREGWDGAAATALLRYVMQHVVAPQVAAHGLRGPAADQAAASAWAATWDALRSPAIGSAASPWGVVWVAARRAILGEDLASTYGTLPRTAWRLVQDRASAPPRPLSLTALAETGWEPTADAVVGAPGADVLQHIAAAMVDAGWEPAQARDVLEAVAAAAPWGERSGWRVLARQLGVEAWRVRRLIETLQDGDVVHALGRPSGSGSDLVEQLHWTTTRRVASTRNH